MNVTLGNRTIVVTRGEEQARSMLAGVERLGGTALWFPTVKISASRDRRACFAAVQEIDSYDWLVFASANSVRFFTEMTKRLTGGSTTCKIAAVGKKTEEELSQLGVSVDLVPATFSAAGLLHALADHEIRGRRFLIPVSNIAREELTQGLESMGAKVETVTVYRTDPNHGVDGDAMGRMIDDNKIDCLTFCSPSAFRYFLEIVGADTASRIKRTNLAVGAIGPTTSRTIERAGIDNIIVPERSLEEDLISAIAEYFDTRT